VSGGFQAQFVEEHAAALPVLVLGLPAVAGRRVGVDQHAVCGGGSTDLLHARRGSVAAPSAGQGGRREPPA
jgi:hypothetical protein